MSSPLNVTQETYWEIPGLTWNRKRYYMKKGARGDKVTPLPYTMMDCQSSGVVSDKLSDAKMVLDAPNAYSAWEAEVYRGVPPWAVPRANAAYQRFKDKAIGENASIGVFAAEMQESLGMIRNRSLTMYRAARALRKGDLGTMASELGVRVKKNHRKPGFKVRPENAAETWLEYWFGWSPFINDFYSVGDVMTQPLPGGRYYGTSRAQFTETLDYNGISITRDRAVHFRVGAEVYLENPNRFLLAQLGLANPAQIVWELIPFSFLVDWVTDFGSFIGSFSDFIGTDVRNAYFTAMCHWSETHAPFYWSYEGGPMTTSGVAMFRTPGLYRPIPNMQITANLGQSLTRTATAVSLLTTTLASMAGRPR